MTRTRSRPTVAEGDWIKLLNHNGGTDAALAHIEESGLAVVRRPHRDGGGGNMIVNLSTADGTIVSEGYYVSWDTNDWEKLPGQPAFTPLLAHIPNTAEVQALKDAVYAEVIRQADRNGYLSSVQQALRKLGIEKPGVARVKGTVTFTFEAAVDQILPASTESTFKRQFDRLNASDKINFLRPSVRAEDLKVEYEVKPYAPVIVPAPAAATPDTTAAESKQAA